MRRISKEEMYLQMALAAAKRGTCTRRNYGAVIVNNDEVISTGYTGSPRGQENCCDRGTCERTRLGFKQGEGYHLCCSVHAEQNALISAARRDTIGGTLYLVGIDAYTGDKLLESKPCNICRGMLINAGIKDIVSYKWNQEDGFYYNIVSEEL